MSTYPFKLGPDALALWRFERRIGGQKTVGREAGQGAERGVGRGVGLLARRLSVGASAENAGWRT